jgi:hypothetical protein
MHIEPMESLLTLAEDLRRRLDRMVGLAATGRPGDLAVAGGELQAAVGGFAELHRGIRAASERPADRPESRPESRQEGGLDHPSGQTRRLAAELQICQRLVRRLAPLIEQGQAIRLAHWTPPPDGGYTPVGAKRADRPGPQLVKHLG